MPRFFTFTLLILTLSTSWSLAQNQDLLGITSADEIRAEFRVFNIYVNRYNPDSSAVEFLKAFDASVEIKIFFGTWCHDSKREIPAFIKTMEEANNPNFVIEYVGVSRKKSDPEGIAESYDLQYTPTFIIFSAENEIGRIVEESTESIELDLVQILKSGDFTDH